MSGSNATVQLLRRLRSTFPDLSQRNKKGENGRVAVVGGESTGKTTLAKALEKTAVSIYQSVELLEKVCKICAPYMGKPK